MEGKLYGEKKNINSSTERGDERERPSSGRKSTPCLREKRVHGKSKKKTGLSAA